MQRGWAEWWIIGLLCLAVCWLGTMLREPTCTGTLVSVATRPAPDPYNVMVLVTIDRDGECVVFRYFGEPWRQRWIAQSSGTVLTWRHGVVPSPPWPGDDR